jgi:hypothetical protein
MLLPGRGRKPNATHRYLHQCPLFALHNVGENETIAQSHNPNPGLVVQAVVARIEAVLAQFAVARSQRNG